MEKSRQRKRTLIGISFVILILSLGGCYQLLQTFNPQHQEASHIEPVIYQTDGMKLEQIPVEIPRANVSAASGHSDIVSSVAFSPDGRFALSGSDDKTLRLWETNTGREIRSFIGHWRPVTCIAFSPDGKFALSGSDDKTIRLWDVETGRSIRSFEKDSFSVSSIAFSPDGRLALSGSSYKTLKLWDVKTGREIRSFKGHKSRVFSVAFSPDGKSALSGSHDKTLRLWNVKTGKSIRSFKGHSDDVNAVAFSPDGKFALSGSDDGTLRLWKVSTGRSIRSFKGHSGEISSVAFSPDGKFALSGSYDKTVTLWEVRTGKKTRSFRGHSDIIHSVAFGPGGKFVLSGSGDNTLKLWEVVTGREIHSFKGYSRGVASVALSPGGTLALMGSDDMTLRLWDAGTGREIRSFRGHSKGVTSAAFSPDGKFALSGSYDRMLRLWEVSTGREIRSFKGHTDDVNAVAFSPDGKFALSGSYDKSLRLWKISTGREIRSYQGHLYGVNAVAFSPDGEFAISGSYDKTLRLWDVKTGREIRTFRGHTGSVNAAAFSPDGKFVLSGSHDKTLRLWEAETGLEIRTFEAHSKPVSFVAFSPDGKLGLSASHDNTVSLWDISTGQEIRYLRGHLEPVMSVAFSPDGKFALSGSQDGTMRVWNIPTGRETARMFSFTDDEWIVMTPEGYYDASVNGSRHLNVSVGGNIYTARQYEAICYRPDIVRLALKLGNTREAIIRSFKIGRPIFMTEAQPPKAWFVSPYDHYETDDSRIAVRVRTEDATDAVASVTFKVNHRPLATEEKSEHLATTGAEIWEFSGQIPLIIGNNWITAEARSKTGLTQTASPILVVRKGKGPGIDPKKLPTLWYFGAGVGTHSVSELSLSSPAKDIEGLAEILKKQEGPVYSNVNVRTLTDREATRDNIVREVRTFFENAAQEDVAILFVSGYMMSSISGHYFISHDADPDKLSSTGVSWSVFDDVMRTIKSSVLLLADTCHSRNVIRNESWKAQINTDPNEFLRGTVRNGVIVLSSGSGPIVPGKSPPTGHGAFAKALLDGFKGQGAAQKKGVVRLSFLQDYVRDTVKELTRNTQEPIILKLEGGAFLDLVLARK